MYLICCISQTTDLVPSPAAARLTNCEYGTALYPNTANRLNSTPANKSHTTVLSHRIYEKITGHTGYGWWDGLDHGTPLASYATGDMLPSIHSNMHVLIKQATSFCLRIYMVRG